MRKKQLTYTFSEVMDGLEPLYGRPVWRPHRDPTAELVLTVLSQNTSDSNSGRAFSRLIRRFPNWDAIGEAPSEDIEAAIKPGGLAATKAPRLKAMLAEVRQRTGGFDLSFLRERTLVEAKDWLQTLPAVGPKTAACVLLFGLGRPALPVDTHVFRVSMRLGLIEGKMTPGKAQTYLEAQVPEADQFRFHILLIRHGRHTCTARGPACARCPLAQRCPASTLAV